MSIRRCLIFGLMVAQLTCDRVAAEAAKIHVNRLTRSLAAMIKAEDRAGFAVVVDAITRRGDNVEELNRLLGPAAVSQDPFFIDFLLFTGCDINVLNSHGENIGVFVIQNAKGELAETALQELAERGLDLHRPDKDGFRLVHKAALQNRGDILMSLVHFHKAKIDAKTNGGQTSLMLAAHYGHADALEAALLMGADKTLTDPDGRTAAAIAMQPFDRDVFEQAGINAKGRERALELLQAK